MRLRFLQGYDVLAAEQTPRPRFYDLSQDPLKRPTMSTKGALPCLKRNSRLWHSTSARFMTTIELGAAMGLATFQLGAETARVPLDTCRYDYGMGELGNTMHVSCVGAILAIALACVEPI